MAPNESLLRRLGLQTNLYCTDSGLQTNLYCADSGSKRISTVPTRDPNESLLHRLGIQTNLYCTDSGSKRISTVQTRAPNDVIYSRWQWPYWDALASLFYSGRKWRCVVHLFLQSMEQSCFWEGKKGVVLHYHWEILTKVCYRPFIKTLKNDTVSTCGKWASDDPFKLWNRIQKK